MDPRIMLCVGNDENCTSVGSLNCNFSRSMFCDIPKLDSCAPPLLFLSVALALQYGSIDIAGVSLHNHLSG